MVIEDLSLAQFRNYEKLTIQFDPKLNFFLGKNGQGKTNLLESLYYLTHLKSFRTSITKNLLSFDEKQSFLGASVMKRKITHDIRVQLEREGKKVFLNHKRVALSSDYIKDFFSLIFAPDQISAFKEFPAERRQFFDRVLSLLSDGYFQRLKDFLKIRKNKTILLKNKKVGELQSWNQLMAETVPTIVQARIRLTERVNQILSSLFNLLTGRKDELLVGYSSDFSRLENLNREEVYRFLQENRENEITQGRAIYGPQRDQIWMMLNGKKDKYFFSQGEFRVAHIALKLAVGQIIAEKLKFHPVLLLDDIFSELDQNVCDRVVELIYQEQNQVFITATDIPEKFIGLGKVFQIEQGNVL